MTTVNNIYKLAELIAKSIKEELNEEESSVLKNWEESSIYNRDLLRSIKDEVTIDEKLASYSQINWENDYSLFLKKKSKQIRKAKLYSFLKYAAVIILPIAIAATFFLIEKPDYSQQKTVSVIKSGESKATLTLASGEKIDLSLKDMNILKEKDGSIIKTDSGKIAYNYKDTINKEKVIKEKTSRPIYNTLNVPRGGEFFLTLKDGTKIWLNSDTKLRYPVSFSDNKRIVYLEGEAYFDVSKNKQKPFIVITNNSKIKVLGTSFNLKAYANGKNITTTLVEGKVSFYSKKQNKEIILKPGEQGKITSNRNITKKRVDVLLYTSWKNGRFVFKKQRMEDIMITLSRWYNIDIFYQNPSLKDITFTGDLKRYKDFNEIIKIIEITNLVKFEVKGKTIIIRKK